MTYFRTRLRSARGGKRINKNASIMPMRGTKDRSSTIAFHATRKSWLCISSDMRSATTSRMSNSVRNAAKTRIDGAISSLRFVIRHVKALQKLSVRQRLRSARRLKIEKRETFA
jgi:hypothetical protein